MSEPGSLISTIGRTIAENNLLSHGERVLLGVSGGVDSMVLMHLLTRLAPELDLRLGVAHLNHGLRGASSDRDADLVCNAAEGLGLVCHVLEARVGRVKERLGLSLEDAGRRIRHAFFKKTMLEHGYQKLALGHHLDDNAEQVLLALFRGTGPRGLSGIAPKNGIIIRPLIRIRREEILAWAERERIQFAEDASNADVRFVRNRIRHELLPHLADTYNPRIHRHLNRLAAMVRDEEQWIESLVDAPFAKAVINRRKNSIALGTQALNQAHPALGRRLVRRAIESITGTLRGITFDHVTAVLQLADGGGEKMLHLPAGLWVHRQEERLTFGRTAGRGRIAKTLVPKSSAPPVTIDTPYPSKIRFTTMGVELGFSLIDSAEVPPWEAVRKNQAFFDLERLVPPLVLRHRFPGDRFRPLGAQGRQKLKKFFIDHHIGRAERANALILADQRHIIWLLGLRTDATARLRPETTRILRVEFFLLDT